MNLCMLLVMRKKAESRTFLHLSSWVLRVVNRPKYCRFDLGVYVTVPYTLVLFKSSQKMSLRVAQHTTTDS